MLHAGAMSQSKNVKSVKFVATHKTVLTPIEWLHNGGRLRRNRCISSYFLVKSIDKTILNPIVKKLWCCARIEAVLFHDEIS